MLDLFREVDVILAPATPCRAPRSGQTTFVLDGVTLPVRANIGVFTQPISFIGLPVVAVPVRLDDGLPLGVQVIAAPWREDLALRVAHQSGAGRRRPRARGEPVSETAMIIDDPAVKAEVEAAFAAYEAALVGNDVPTLEALFHDDPRTIRYGGAENLYGMEAIRAFRRARSPEGLARDLRDTVDHHLRAAIPGSP